MGVLSLGMCSGEFPSLVLSWPPSISWPSEPGLNDAAKRAGTSATSATFGVSVSDDGTVREWNTYQGSTERLLALGGRRAIALAVSPDARYVVA